ncbi:MAG TPA: TetR/AcrR family transcriptional regulator [Candidatus Bathyarchaeia archaeon]|nr:TetR/AcrR family transcriptional regulator [Candidatus Bathyarchaeia archaeon]
MQFPKSLSPTQKRIQQAALRLFVEKGVDRVNVKELAQSAKVARGTIYNNQRASTEQIFQEIASQLSIEMHERVVATLAGIDDPAQRLATAVRLFVRRAHEESDWGAFIVRFGLNNAILRQMWYGPPRKDVSAGIAKGRYNLRPEQLPSAMSMTATGTLGAIFLVLHGHRSWRKAGSNAAELLLRAFGLPAREAQRIATAELPLLAPAGEEDHGTPKKFVKPPSPSNNHGAQDRK